MADDFEIRTLPARRLYGVRVRARVTELSEKIGAGLGAAVGAAHAQGVKPGDNLVAYFNTAELNMMSEGGGDIAIGALIDADAPKRGEVETITLPGGRYLVTHHVGPYDELHRAHAALHEHVRAKGLPLTGFNWENYGAAVDMSDPSKLVTEIAYQLI